MQVDALETVAQAQPWLADEYDATQARGEVAGLRDGGAGRSGGERPTPVTDLGLTRKAVHEARQIRNAEKADLGVVRRTLDEPLKRDQQFD